MHRPGKPARDLVADPVAVRDEGGARARGRVEGPEGRKQSRTQGVSPNWPRRSALVLCLGVLLLGWLPGPLTSSSPSPGTLVTVAAAATTGAQELVAYSAPGYRYRVVPHGAEAGFEQPSFDDAAWSSGSAAFGTVASCGLAVGTAWPLDTDVLVRKTVDVPAGAAGLVVKGAIDNDVEVFWNGVSLGRTVSEGCARRDSVTLPVPSALVRAGSNVLAARGVDRGVESYLDLSVTMSAGPSVPAQQLFGPAGDAGLASRPVGEQADPVNTATGSLTAQAVDLAVPGIGVGFDLTRTYNSGDATVGVLGRGWVHSWETRLVVDATSGAGTVRAGDGQQLRFTRAADGSYVGGPGALAELRGEAAGGHALTMRDQTVLRFDGAGRLTAVLDRNGQGQAAEYDAEGRLSRVSGSGRSAAFTHDPASGRLTGVALSDGRSVAYGYTDGLLTSVRDVRGQTWTFGYDAAGRLAWERDPALAYVHRTTYDPATGRVSEQLDPRSKRSVFAWDAATQTATMTDPAGGTWSDRYAGNVLQSRTDPRGAVTRYEYDADLRLLALVDALGRRTSFAYDAAGNLTTTTRPDGASGTSVYNARRDVTATTDPSGRQTAYGYDPAGNLTAVTDPAGKSTRYERQPGTGLVTAVTDPTGRSTRYVHDAQGNVVESVDPAGGRTTFGYDAAGRPTATVEPRGNVPGASPATYRTVFAYDEAGNRLSVTDPLGSTTRATFDAVGRLSTETDANGRTTTYTYDEAGHVTAVRGPDSAVPGVRMSYDDRGLLATRTDGKGLTVTYTRNAAGQVEQVSDPLGTSTLRLDLLGRTQAVTDPTGATVTYTLDVLGQRTAVDYPDTTPDVAYAYDLAGRRTSMSDVAGQVSYGYDAAGRLQQVTRGSDAVGYTYDDAGRVLTVALPAANSEAYTYDAAGRVATVSANGTQHAAYAYDAASRVTQTTLPSGHGGVETRSYDPAGRLTAVQTAKGSTLLAKAAYNLDKVGNPLQVVDEAGRTTTYTYDALDRLTAACFSTTTCTGAKDFIRYAYDANNNVTSEQRPAGTVSYTYNALDQLTGRQSGTTTTGYTYDARGNTLTAGGASYGWNLAGRMTSATVSGTTTTYRYDGDGRRLDATSGSSRNSFFWEPTGYALALERDGAGAVTRRHLPAGLGSVSAGAVTYRHGDALGSVQSVTSASGALQWSYDYEPYGAVKRETRQFNKAAANPMQFSGEYKDPTGLTHLRARQLDPATGRFLSLDPFGGGYGYANANPMLYVDPLGLFGWRDGARVIGKGAGWVAAGTSVAAVGFTVTGVGAPIGGALAGVAAVSGAISTGVDMIDAAQACAGPKGGCAGHVAMAAIGSVTGRYTGGLGDDAIRGTRKAAGEVAGRRVGFGPNDPPSRVSGPWTVNDLKGGAFGRTPRSLGSPDLHHGDQLPGSGVHELPPAVHRGNKQLHQNPRNQGVTNEMRAEDRQLHWWYRSQEMGGRDVLGSDYYYD